MSDAMQESKIASKAPNQNDLLLEKKHVEGNLATIDNQPIRHKKKRGKSYSKQTLDKTGEQTIRRVTLRKKHKKPKY